MDQLFTSLKKQYFKEITCLKTLKSEKLNANLLS